MGVLSITYWLGVTNDFDIFWTLKFILLAWNCRWKNHGHFSLQHWKHLCMPLLAFSHIIGSPTCYLWMNPLFQRNQCGSLLIRIDTVRKEKVVWSTLVCTWSHWCPIMAGKLPKTSTNSMDLLRRSWKLLLPPLQMILYGVFSTITLLLKLPAMAIILIQRKIYSNDAEEAWEDNPGDDKDKKLWELKQSLYLFFPLV